LAPNMVIMPRTRDELEIPLKLSPTTASAKGSANRQSIPPTAIRDGFKVGFAEDRFAGEAFTPWGVEGDPFVTTLGVVASFFWGLTA
jgi:hypothetical protein